MFSQSDRRQCHVNTNRVALIHIDDYKTINERFGRTIGEKFLMKVVHLIEHCFREYYLLCRYSCDEFAILLQHVSAQAEH